MKTPQRKTRRVLMAETIRRDCDPVLFGLGFRNPRDMTLDRWETTRRNTYVRWRGTDYDELKLIWARYGRAKFQFRFETSQVETPPRGDTPATRLVRHGWVRSFTGPVRMIGGQWFGPWMTAVAAAALMNRRILELNGFLLSGKVGPHLYVGAPRRISPDDERLLPRTKIWGDPWRDPESDYAPGGSRSETPDTGIWLTARPAPEPRLDGAGVRALGPRGHRRPAYALQPGRAGRGEESLPLTRCGR
jgi:hypothetical protein